MHQNTVQNSRSSRYDHTRYNQLAEIIEANDALKNSTNREALFEAVGSRIVEANLSRVLGLCLLHKHNDVPSGFRMQEKIDRNSDGALALVMALQPASPNIAVPVNWKVEKSDNGFLLFPLEFSCEKFAFDLYEQALQSWNVVAAMAGDICDAGMEDRVGIALLRHAQLPCPPNFTLVEQSDDKLVANIVQAESQDEYADSDLIQTHWEFRRQEEPTLGCSPRCLSQVGCYVNLFLSHQRTTKHKAEHFPGSF
jgi:hypothetical protein